MAKSKRKKTSKTPHKNGYDSNGNSEEQQQHVETSVTKSESTGRVFLVTSSISLAVYFKTVAPSIIGGDTGELLAEACQLGTAHPPGYPLYMILVYGVLRMGRWLDDDTRSPAYYANCLSCVLGAMASGFVSASVILFTMPNNNKSDNTASSSKTILIREAAAVTAGLLHSFSRLAWQYSVTAEVFALHNFFVALLIYVTICFAQSSKQNTKHTRLVYLGAFLCGIAMTNQHTSILLEIPIILWVAYERRLHQRPKLLKQVTACFLLGLSIYVYLPISAFFFPHAGAWGDVTSLTGLLNHIRRKDYGTFQLYSGDKAGSEGFWPRLYRWAMDFQSSEAGNPLNALFAVFGIRTVCASWIKSRKTIDSTGRDTMAEAGLVLVVALIFYLVVFFNMSNLSLSHFIFSQVFKRFFMHPNVICFFFMGIGMTTYAEKVSRSNHTTRPQVLLLLLMVLSVLHSLWRNYEINNHIGNYRLHNYGHALLDPLPSDSLLFITSEVDWESARYLQECEGVRPDVTSVNMNLMTYTAWFGKHIPLYDQINFPAGSFLKGDDSQRPNGFTLLELLDANYAAFEERMFVSMTFKRRHSKYHERYSLVNYGLVDQILTKNAAAAKDVERFRQESRSAWKVAVEYMGNDVLDSKKYLGASFEVLTRIEFFKKLMERATMLATKATSGIDERSILSSLLEAVAWLEMTNEAVALLELSNISGIGQRAATLSKNLGVAYLRIQGISFNASRAEMEEIFAETRNTAFMSAIDDIWWTSESAQSWKEWAAIRWYKSWSEFFDTKDAKADRQYQDMRKIWLEKKGKYE